MRVCYFGTYRASYVRNRLLIEGLRRNGVDVVECHEQLWHGIDDRVDAVKGKWKSPVFLWRILAVYARLLRKYWALHGDYDIMVVGYPGQFDLILARLLTWLRRRPLAWDVLMSIYLVAVERGLHLYSPWVVYAIRLIERCAMPLPDLLIVDTEEYAAWYKKSYGVARDRIRLLPIGVDSDAFQEHPDASSNSVADSKQGRPFRVLYYGTFIDNHGVPIIVRAARLLAAHSDIRFELAGDGPQRPQAEFLVRRYRLSNVELIDWLDGGELRNRIDAADLCLGVFGVTPQSMMTVHNKIKECMAMGKPVLSGDSPAVRDEFEHGKHIYLCPRADPAALANAIVLLQQQPGLRSTLGRQSREFVQRNYTIEINGSRFRKHLEGLLSQRRRTALR